MPAAISAVLGAIGNGANFVICADINSFFTRIPKSEVSAIVADAVCDPDFMRLFSDAIRVELANMAELRGKAHKFPIGDIGVAQGNSLSPLLGNIILHDFDRIMNEGDCSCFRYIDDFIILAPTKRAAIARLERAKRLLAEYGMTLSESKTYKEPIDIRNKFEFLGIAFHDGLIRPCTKAQENLVAAIRDAFQASQLAFAAQRTGEQIPKAQSLVSTLKRVDGIIQGWGKHYKFCNDERVFYNLDNRIQAEIRKYLGAYRSERERAAEEKRPMLLGVELLGQIDRRPFEWPRRRKSSRDLSEVLFSATSTFA